MSKRLKFPKGSVCKPCWELKYCPYGPLVEFFPILSNNTVQEDVEKRYHNLLAIIGSGELKTEQEIWDALHSLMYHAPWNWRELNKYDLDLINCNVWGHSCPVFLMQSDGTETRMPRPSSRYISRNIMLKVVRRDNYRCQICGDHVPDKEIDFDHIIPFSLGGPTSVENIRLTHRRCNLRKSNHVDEILTK